MKSKQINIVFMKSHFITFKFSMFVFLVLLFSCSGNNVNNEMEQEPQQTEKLPYDNIGALSGRFSVSPFTTVRFSRGLLQYNDNLKEWRFREAQNGRCDPDNIANKTGWFDTFGWATSGYNNYSPTLTGKHYDDGFYLGMEEIGATELDWGYYNKISNGGNTRGLWRTLSVYEWDYLLNDRPNAYEKLGFGYIEGCFGMILLPDDWTAPDNCPFKQFAENSHRDLRCVASEVEYSYYDWKKMEMNGAVFLDFSRRTKYWSSSAGRDRSVAWSCYLSNSLSLGQQEYEPIYSSGRQYQHLVRLVTDL